MTKKNPYSISSAFAGNEELPVAELLADPIMGEILKRDGLTLEQVNEVVYQARSVMRRKKAA